MKTAPHSFPRPGARSAFTLVELMVSMAILGVILVLMTQIIDATGKTWASTTGKIEQFREARQGFETIVRRLSQATLNTYYDYDWTNLNLPPTRYIRQSELRFISGPSASLIGDKGDIHPTHSVFFQAPLGFVSNSVNAPLKNLLNTWGYWIEYVSDTYWRPPFIADMTQPAAKPRFRLMEMMEPSESMSIYSYTSGSSGAALNYPGKQWFTNSAQQSVEDRPARPLADNIIAMVLLPKLSPQDDPTGTALSPKYAYDSSTVGMGTTNPNLDSRNQLPPVVQVTIVAVDEKSFARIYPKADESTPPETFGLDGLFGDEGGKAGDLHDPTNPGFAQDLQTLQNTLTQKHLVYRVFTTNVSIRAAKWSRAQTN